MVDTLQDPVKDGEGKIKGDFDELYEEMQTTFRNLEDQIYTHLLSITPTTRHIFCYR